MANVMVTLPNIGGALCLTPQSLADAHYYMLSCNAAKKRKPLKVAGVSQTPETISAASGRSSPYCGDMWRRYCCLTSVFLVVDTCLSCEDIARQNCGMVPKWQFLASCISASHVQHISDLHSKFTLRPHHVWKYGRHPISDH